MLFTPCLRMFSLNSSAIFAFIKQYRDAGNNGATVGNSVKGWPMVRYLVTGLLQLDPRFGGMCQARKNPHICY